MPPPVSYPSTGSSIALVISTILMLIGYLVVMATIPLSIIGIIFLVQSSSIENEVDKKKKKKIGIISCVVGPALIILIIILYAITTLIFH